MSRVAPKTGELVFLPNRIKTARLHRVIFERQNGLCQICGRELIQFDIDHRVPLAMGGTNADDNLEAICREPCHKTKTRQDIKAIAKAKRREIKAFGDRKPSKLKPRGFQKGVRRDWPKRGFGK